MNYRHSFHAGNFADIVKHALLLWLLERRQAQGPVSVIDTHAGAGLYDLSGDAARSKEAEAGVARLNEMKQAGRDQLLICGIEAHVCVLQSALGASRGVDVSGYGYWPL